MGWPEEAVNRRRPPYRLWGLVSALLLIAITVAGYGQFRGAFTPWTRLTLHSDRAGLVMEPGAKVTFNGVEIGRVVAVDAAERDGTTIAALSVQVQPKYARMLPANVQADITATTVFGNKYVSLTSPEHPSTQRISPADIIDVHSVSTEFNTLFETIMSIAEQVDPVRLNTTLSATAEALTGLGDRFGTSLVDGNQILDQITPRMPRLRQELTGLANLADIYAAASPDLWQALDHAATTAGTLNRQRADLDAALLAAVGFGETAGDVFDRGAPYMVRAAEDLIPTAQLLDRHSPALYCTIRNYAQVGPRVAASLGGNGYSLASYSGGGVTGAEPPYIYPDNLPRLNARGGPGGAPGCWQSITRELWPAPYLVMDTGASIAPYNHLEIGQPAFVEYVWGRQIGEYTINP